MRLQVFLSHSGICSRRKALELVKFGAVKVNNKIVTEPSFQIDPKQDHVSFNNKRIEVKNYVYIMLHKPEGVTTTKMDKFAEETVIDLLPDELKHLHPVGRLDKETSGLLLLTNDGNFTYKLTHPKFEIKKNYEAVLNKKLSQADKMNLEQGVIIEDGMTSPCKIRILSDKLQIEIHEGKKRQIRRMFAEFGYHVKALKRISEAGLDLGDLEPGAWRFLTKEEIVHFA